MFTNLKCPRCSVPLRVEQKERKAGRKIASTIDFYKKGFFERKAVNHWHTHLNSARITAEL